jgi:hypothetical protein
MGISREDFRRKANHRIIEARQFCSKWHKTAREEYDFVAGQQWKPEDQEALRLQNRPDITFNYSEKMIDAVVGAEVGARQEVTYKARQMENEDLSELWTNAARWVRDECNAEDEETDSFRDALICGMGWTFTRMDYTEDKDGMPIVERIDPMEMYWDPAGTKGGLADRRFDVHGVWMDNDLVKAKWPNRTITNSDDQQSGSMGIIRTGHRYLDDNDFRDDVDRHVDQTMVWHYECVELETYYRVATGDGNIAEIAEEDFGAMKKQLDAFGLKYVKEQKKVYYRAFLADEFLLEWGKSPCQKGFMRNCITGKRDRNKNIWYGLVRVMRDPQMWANKWLSQIMYIINSNAKGGLLAEQGAFVDPRKAEEDWASPNSLTMLNEGGLARVEQKQITPYPAGLAELMNFALGALPQVTGINLEALGLADRDQANVVEQSRKQAAYGLLAPIFDSLRQYRKRQGKVLLDFIRQFISDGRLVKINGVGSARFIPLTKIPDAVEFDIIVDQAPTAPDVKSRTWETLMQIVPAMIKAGEPIPPEVIEYAPLPQEMISKWQKFLLQAQQNKGMNPQQQQQMMEQMQKLQQENQQLKSDQSREMGELQLKQQKQSAELALKAKEIEGKLALEEMDMKGKLAIQAQANNHDMQLQTHKTQGDLKIKAASAGLSPDDKGDISMKIDTSDIANSLQEVTQTFANSLREIVGAMNAPKKIIRDANGRPVGVAPA